MANIPSIVAELVETFDRNIEAYRSQKYNEAQLRREFIDKLTSPTNKLTISYDLYGLTEEKIKIVKENI